MFVDVTNWLFVVIVLVKINNISNIICKNIYSSRKNNSIVIKYCTHSFENSRCPFDTKIKETEEWTRTCHYFEWIGYYNIGMWCI